MECGSREFSSIIRSFFFFFSLFHQRADDEALTRFLQTSLFLVASPILVKSMFFSFRSSLTLSIQVFLCLPLSSSVSLCLPLSPSVSLCLPLRQRKTEGDRGRQRETEEDRLPLFFIVMQIRSLGNTKYPP